MPTGKAALTGGRLRTAKLGINISGISASLDQRVKRGYPPLSDQQKSELAQRLYDAINHFVAVERGFAGLTSDGHAPRATQLRNEIKTLITASRRWIATGYSETSPWKERVIERLDQLSSFSRAAIWKGIWRTLDGKPRKRQPLFMSSLGDSIELGHQPIDVHYTLSLIESFDIDTIKSSLSGTNHTGTLIIEAAYVWRTWTGRSTYSHDDDLGAEVNVRSSRITFYPWFCDTLRRAHKSLPIPGTKLVQQVASKLKI